MRLFTFSLEKVLEVRRVQEDVQRQRLAAALADQARVELGLEAIEARLAATMQVVGLGRLVLADLLQRETYQNLLLDRRLEAREELAGRAREVAKERQQLLARAQERRVLERLRERRLAVYLQEAARKDQVQLDDIAAGRWLKIQGS